MHDLKELDDIPAAKILRAPLKPYLFWCLETSSWQRHMCLERPSHCYKRTSVLTLDTNAKLKR